MSKRYRNLNISSEGLTNPESATDSCADSEGDLQIKPACAVKVDVELEDLSRRPSFSSQLSVLRVCSNEVFSSVSERWKSPSAPKHLREILNIICIVMIKNAHYESNMPLAKAWRIFERRELVPRD